MLQKESILLAKALLLVALLASSVAAQSNPATSIEVRQAWSRATPPAAPVAVGFAMIINSSNEADRLLSIEATISESVELHETTVVDRIARMRAVARLEIAGGSTVVLKPSGLHLMFIKPKAPLREGEKFKATLRFEKAGAKEAEFSVLSLGARDASHGGHGAKTP